ncbi:MAG: hypothetical protein ACYS9X_18410, partial [Planctomycetota bacterium]
GGEELGRRIGLLNESMSALKGRIDSIEADLASITAKSGDASKALADLGARVAQTESGVARVGRSLKGIPEAPAAGGAGIDPEKLREAVQAQIRAQFDRFRQQGMAGRGGDRRDPMQTLREDVGLDEAKATKVVKAEQKMREEIGRYFRENRGGDRDAARKMIEKAHENARAELAKSLTPEEMKKYGVWHDRQRRGGGRGRGGPQRQQPREQDRPDDNAAF